MVPLVARFLLDESILWLYSWFLLFHTLVLSLFQFLQLELCLYSVALYELDLVRDRLHPGKLLGVGRCRLEALRLFAGMLDL